MAIQCFCNDDIRKLVVEIQDRHHYLTVLEADVLLEEIRQTLARAVAEGQPRVKIHLQGREYQLKPDETKLLMEKIKEQSDEAVTRYGRPEPVVNVQERLVQAQAENARLKAELAKSYQEREALQGAAKGKGKL